MYETFVGQRKRTKVIMSHQLPILATSGWTLRPEGTAGVIYIYLFTWAFWTGDWLGGIFSLKPFDYRWLTRVNTCIDKMVEVCPDNLKVKKHCQRHNGTKALSTLTHSTPLVLTESSTAWFCLAKGEKYIEHLCQIHVTTLTNPWSNLDKSMWS